MEKIFTQKDLDERLIRAKHLKDVENLSDTIVVVYADTDTIFIYDATSLSELERESLVKFLIFKIQSGTNYSREIIAKSGNVYFVY